MHRGGRKLNGPGREYDQGHDKPKQLPQQFLDIAARPDDFYSEKSHKTIIDCHPGIEM